MLSQRWRKVDGPGVNVNAAQLVKLAIKSSCNVDGCKTIALTHDLESC